MLVIVGMGMVFASLFLGFVVLSGGSVALLFSVPGEFVIIIGAAVASLIVGNPMYIFKRIISGAIGTIKGPNVSKAAYVDLLKLMYELFQFAKREGLIALEPHVESPESSSIMSKYPSFLSNHHGVNFLCDTLKVVLSGGVPAHDLEELMDIDLESLHEEENMPPSSLQVMADAFPGLGIVAAVLGIIKTMASINEGAEAVGHHVAGALVGTFLGVLLSYGIFGPLAAQMKSIVIIESRYLVCIKSGLLSFAKGAPGSVAIEYARRSIDPENRPTFKESEDAIKGTK